MISFIDEHRPVLGVEPICKLLPIAPSTYYGTTETPVQTVRVESALLKALARGFRWRKLLETRDFTTIEEIAETENINPSYASRVMRMTLLSPEIVEAILDGRQPAGLTMARALQPFPWEWRHQSFR